MTMLANAIMQSKGHPGIALTSMPEALSKAVCFEITDGVCIAASQVTESSASRILDARSFARVPFLTTWFEWQHSSARYSTEGYITDERSHAQEPKRCGVLIQAKPDLKSGTATWAWTTDDDIAVCPVSVTFNFSSNPGYIPDLRRLRPDFDEVLAAAKSKTSMSKASDDHWFKLNKAYGLIPSPLVHPLIEEMNKLDKISAAKWWKIMWEESCSDLNGEPSFLESLLVVINSKNLVSVKPPEDFSKLNKHRIRRGKHPLLPFSKVEISLSKSAKRSFVLRDEEMSLRAHIVRGHFKVRKSGIFWWSPFLRGDADKGTIVRDGYVVNK